ncbi:MAG: hypothetical protein V1758_14510 [Pseudomonadota bacterium]
MNYARHPVIHARHLPNKVCLIERTPSKNQRRTLTCPRCQGQMRIIAFNEDEEVI